jgi:hypothetical protein
MAEDKIQQNDEVEIGLGVPDFVPNNPNEMDSEEVENDPFSEKFQSPLDFEDLDTEEL